MPCEPAPFAWMRGHASPLNYHRLMLGDGERMAAFERAIRQRVRPGDVVLDLGCGTGILAMLAARAGAARVHAVESMPIAALARKLVAANGLAGRVIVHQAEATTLEPVEPVDLVLGDFIGRFLVDDGMLPAVAAAARWLKPGGGFCPDEIRLLVAPVGNHRIEAIDGLGCDVLGVDLRPALPHALRLTYQTTIEPGWVLGLPGGFALFRPGEREPAFDAELDLPLHTGGTLRGLAGWFEARLADGVVLGTGPGVETHWGQNLFPLPATPVLEGDRVVARLRLVDLSDGPVWRWSGEVRRGPQVLAAFDLDSWQRYEDGPVEAPLAEFDATEALRLAHTAFTDGRLAEAASLWEAVVRRTDPRDPILPRVFENLGLAWYNLGRDVQAISAFLRALDGDPTGREQSLRFLVDACWRAGRYQDAQRHLDAYCARFGAHPSFEEDEDQESGAPPSVPVP